MRATSAASIPANRKASRTSRPATWTMGETDMRATTSDGSMRAKFAPLQGGRGETRAWDQDPDLPDWSIDVPLRLRGRSRRGGPDVALEFVRVDVGHERPPGTPARVPTRASRSQSWPRRAADLCETALVVACLGAADPHGTGARVSLALAAGGAARAATFAVASRRCGADEAQSGGGSRRRGWTARAADPGALLARLCDAAFALHVSGAVLRVVSPQTHHATKSAAALLGVRVAFSQPTKRRRRARNRNEADSGAFGSGFRVLHDTHGRESSRASDASTSTVYGVDVEAWHARYRWAALRLAPFVPPRPSAPRFKNALAALAAVAVAATSAGADDPYDVARGLAGHAKATPGTRARASAGRGGITRGPCRRLDVSWGSRSQGKSAARRPALRGGRWGGAAWATRGDAHGVNLRVAFADLDQVTAADILAPAQAEPPSTTSSAASSPSRSGGGNPRVADASDSDAEEREGRESRRGGGGGEGETDSGASTLARSSFNARAKVSESAASESAATADSGLVSAGTIWSDARFDGRAASTFELLTRATYLALAFLPVFAIALPLLVLAESETLKRLSGAGSVRGDSTAAARRLALRRRAFTVLHFSVSSCGAALVKWAQWASVRRDVFPSDFCDAMGHFHDDAPKHAYAQTAREVRRHLGVPIERVFSHFPREPVASGSVAQVYRAVLRPEVATACAARDPEFARRVAMDARRHRKMEVEARVTRARERRSRIVFVDERAPFDETVDSRFADRRIAGGGVAARFFGFARSSSDGETADALAGSVTDATDADVDASSVADLSARTVAVKVRHPGVARQIFLDFQILKRAARAVSGISAFRGLNLEETLGQFSHTMTSQTDLRVEAKNLRRFGRNFRNATQVLAPWPVVGLVEEGVLCETFERGEALSSAIRRGCEDNTTTCALGVDTYLKMLLRDNFLHSDLHPGNILYHRETDFERNLEQTRRYTARANSSRNVAAVKLVLLDFGIADELPRNVRDRFLTFLFSLARQDGVAAANSLLTWSEHQTCVGAEADALREDVTRLVNEKCALEIAPVDIDDVLKRVMVLLRKRGVSIDAVFASLVVSMCVLVGFATALDENLNLFEVAISAFLSWSVTGDVVGKLYA